MKDLIKVRIDKAHGWYYDAVGIIINVFDVDSNLFYGVENTEKTIFKSHCTVISDTDKKEPKDYHPSRTDELYLHFFQNHSIIFSTYELNEIIDIAVNSNKDDILEDISKKDLTVSLKVFEANRYKEEPVLIAKAGNKVRIVDLGDYRNVYLTVNKEYKLEQDLYGGGNFVISKDDQGDNHEFDKSAVISYGFKFEKVVEEPVKEESEPTEHDKLLDKAEVAFSIAGFKFERKDLDMIVSMQELVSKFGGKLDLDTINRAKFEVEERYKTN